MRAHSIILSVALALGAAASHADTLVDVAFAPNGRFIDAGETPRDIERTEATLTRQFQALGQRWLPAGAKLKLVVTEIDLAGRVPPGRIDRMRVMNGGADWPRIAMRFELVAADGKADRGEVSLSDMSYLDRPITTGSGGSLPYERRMLEEWFKARFENLAPAPG